MSSNLYVSAAGAMARLTQLDLVANNLANAGTTGYKRDGAMFESVLQSSLRNWEGAIVPGAPGLNFVRSFGVGSDFEAGSIEKTGVPLDFAILGQGFLEIQTGEGLRYTRAGSLKVDAEGNLTTRDGQQVMGSDGPILASGAGIHISPSGQILDSANTELGRMKFVEFEDLLKLKKIGNQRFEALPGANPTEIERPSLAPRSLEGSNVNTIFEMSTLVVLQRAFEANMRILQADDEATKRLIREVRG